MDIDLNEVLNKLKEFLTQTINSRFIIRKEDITLTSEKVIGTLPVDLVEFVKHDKKGTPIYRINQKKHKKLFTRFGLDYLGVYGTCIETYDKIIDKLTLKDFKLEYNLDESKLDIQFKDKIYNTIFLNDYEEISIEVHIINKSAIDKVNIHLW